MRLAFWKMSVIAVIAIAVVAQLGLGAFTNHWLLTRQPALLSLSALFGALVGMTIGLAVSCLSLLPWWRWYARLPAGIVAGMLSAYAGMVWGFLIFAPAWPSPETPYHDPDILALYALVSAAVAGVLFGVRSIRPREEPSESVHLPGYGDVGSYSRGEKG